MADANEPKVKREDFLAPLRQYTPPAKLARERDALSGRYRIQMTQPLAEFSSAFAKAYGVRDEQSPETPLYALVYENNVPLRQKNITTLKTFRHPNLVSLVDDGVADISTLGESRRVLILERPQGQTLAQRLAQGRNPVPETLLIGNLLRPLSELLVAFSKLGISHNRINLNTVYLSGNALVLGECVSEPSGYSQDFLFEPIERLQTSSWAKADMAITADCYAVAVLALHLLLGFKPYAQATREDWITEILTKGPYHALAIQWDIPESLQDFFRGVLNDSRRERWDAETIASSLMGRRFNLILPSLPRETARGFEFMGQNHYNCKSLAHALSQHWQEARALLQDNKLARWLETGVHKPETADAVLRLTTTPDNTRSERATGDALSRTIMLLDPPGPVRLKNIAAAPEGIGQMLTHAFLAREQQDMQLLLQMIDSDLPGFWLEQQKGAGDQSVLTNLLQKIRLNVRMTHLGFGMERCIYDLNPTLPCQSPLVKRYHVTDLMELLLALDAIAVQRAGQDDYMDRHIASFIASRLEIAKETRIHELDALPELASNPKLVALKLLVRAQQMAGNPALRGLSAWVASQLFPLLDIVHKRDLRHDLQEQLHTVSARGMLQPIAGILLNPEIFVADYSDFRQAAASYAHRNAQITELKNHTYLARHARMAGRGIAQTVAYTISLATVFITLKSYFHY